MDGKIHETELNEYFKIFNGAGETIVTIDKSGCLHIKAVATDENAQEFLKILNRHIPISGIHIGST